MVYLLHIDTSGAPGTIALGGDGQLLAQRTIEDARTQAAVVNILIDNVLQEAGITMAQLSGVVVCAGPGSYTGLRIGMATAKALCYVLDIPLIQDNKLTLLTQQSYKENKNEYDVFAALLKARDKEYFFTSHNEKLDCIIFPQHLHQTDLSAYLTAKRILLTTDVATEVLKPLTASHIEIITYVNINVFKWIQSAFTDYKCNKFVNLSTAEPFYLKQAYTT